MAGATNAESAATLDARFPTAGATDHVAYSVNGSSEWTGLDRTEVGATNWAAATVADPSVKENVAGLVSDLADEAGTVSHYAIFTASVAGTQRTDWIAFTTPRVLAIGDSVSWAAGALKVTLT